MAEEYFDTSYDDSVQRQKTMRKVEFLIVRIVRMLWGLVKIVLNIVIGVLVNILKGLGIPIGIKR